MAATEKSESGRKAEADGQLIETQIAQLQADLKAIAATLASLADNEGKQVRSAAKSEFAHLAANSQQAVAGIEDELANIEGQVKQTIRDRPLIAVLGAVAVGYLLAVLSR